MEQLTIDVDEAAVQGWELADRFRRAGWSFTLLPLPAFAGEAEGEDGWERSTFFVEVNGGMGRTVRMKGKSMAELAPLLITAVWRAYRVAV